jgi:hypothetical protein
MQCLNPAPPPKAARKPRKLKKKKPLTKYQRSIGWKAESVAFR